MRLSGPYHYFGYGVSLQSDFDLSRVGLRKVKKDPSAFDTPLIVSKEGTLAVGHGYVNNQTAVNTTNGYYYKEKIGLFKFNTGAKIDVLVDCKGSNTDFVRTLLNYPIACSFYQKKIFSLHASAVVFEGKVIIFPGSALTGKSTIAAYFIKNGGQLITEDTAVIEFFDNRAYVRSSYPFIKLSKSANFELSFSSSEGIMLPTDRNERVGYILNDESFSEKIVPIDYCVFLEYSDRESVESLRLTEATLKLLGSSLNIYPLTKIKQRELFHWSANLARCLKIFRFRRRRGILLSRFLADFIIKN